MAASVMYIIIIIILYYPINSYLPTIGQELQDSQIEHQIIHTG